MYVCMYVKYKNLKEIITRYKILRISIIKPIAHNIRSSKWINSPILIGRLKVAETRVASM